MGAPPSLPFRPPQLPPALKWVFSVGGLLTLAAAALLLGSFYVVQPTEMAGVRRLGTVVTDKAVGPGLHFKLPLVDVVDTIQTSLDTFKLNNLTVYTINNQAVTVSLGISTRIPPSAVLKLLYGVGRSGNVDINENIRPVLARISHWTEVSWVWAVLGLASERQAARGWPLARVWSARGGCVRL